MAGTRRNPRLTSDGRFAARLVAPVILYLVAVMLLPFFWGIGMSFTNKTAGVADAAFVGLRNYTELLKTREIYQSTWVTLLFTAVSIAGKALFGIILALLLNMRFKGRSLVRALMLIPWALPNIVVVLNWRWIFAGSGGALNALLRKAGLISQNLAWTGDPSLALLTVIIANVWRGVPFFGINVLSGLTTIPADLYESAELDGCGALKKFAYITLPSVKGVLLMTTLVSMIWTLNEFDSIWQMTGGGPLNRTMTLAVYSYKTAMYHFRIGRGVAISVLTMPLMILLIYGVNKAAARRD